MSNLPFAKKSLGQHWLTDQASLQAMCEAAAITAGDMVLEIGPGLGTLTAELVKRATQVIAVEFDKDLAEALPDRVRADNLQVVMQDILRFDFSELPVGYKLVANIPYYLTNNLMRILSETANPPATASLLVQKEVAERVTAKPGDMSLLSVTTQWYWNVDVGREVPAQLFTPPPKVDSQILILKRRKTPLFDGVDTKQLFRIVKAGFAQRRKTLLNSLGAGLHLTKLETEEMLNKASITPTTRAQMLSLEQWHQLYLAML